MDIIMWGMELLNVHHLPSVSTLKDISSKQQEEVGIRTLRYEGALGNIYYANSLADTIAQVRLFSLSIDLYSRPHWSPSSHLFTGVL